MSIKMEARRQKRCCVCATRVGLLEFRCLCDDNKIFCLEHHTPKKHNCQFDHETHNNSKIKKLIKDAEQNGSIDWYRLMELKA